MGEHRAALLTDGQAPSNLCRYQTYCRASTASPSTEGHIKCTLSCLAVPQSCLTLCNPTDCKCQASLPFTVSRSWLRLMSTESVMPCNQLVLWRPLLLLPSIFPSIKTFSSELAFSSGGQSIGASAPASLLPMRAVNPEQ